MIATIDPAAVLNPSAPSNQAQTPPSPAPPPQLTPFDEDLFASLLNGTLTLTGVTIHHKLPYGKLIAWWSQPHIKAALAAMIDLNRARATLLASENAPAAVNALQSCTVLADCDFYEQADPKTRQRAFESARKSAAQLLRLAGLPRPSRARTHGSARGVSPAPAPSRSERTMPSHDPSKEHLHPQHHAGNGTAPRTTRHQSAPSS